MNELTHLDLFSGIGGFALAAKWAGFRTIGFCEIDPFCCKVISKHWPRVTNYGDVRTVKNISATLITGGFPCQPVSHAGQRRGEEDHRWLWPEMFEAIQSCRPEWILAENVDGLVTYKGGVLLDKVFSDLEGANYETLPPFVIPASAVDANHRRYRVWILAYSRHYGRSTEQRQQQGQRAEIANSSSPGNVADAATSGLSKPGHESREQAPDEEQRAKYGGRWTTEPFVGRVAHGIPSRVDRLRGLGNAIVPQVAYQILKAIAQIEQGSGDCA